MMFHQSNFVWGNYRLKFSPVILALGLISVIGVSAGAQDENKPELPPEEQAKEHFNRALELKTEAETDKSKEIEMVSEYKLCLSLDPNFVDAYTNLGVHYFAQKNYAEAEKQFKKATEIDKTDTTAFDNLGKIYSKLHKYDEAQKAFAGGIAANSSYASGHKEIGKLLYKQRKYKECAASLISYNALVTDDHYGHYLLGQSYKKQKDYANALKEFRATIKLKKNYSNAHNAMGQIYLTQEKFAKAISAYRSSVKHNSKGYRAYYNLAIAIQSNDPDDLDGSIAAWKQALKVAKKYPKAKVLADQATEQIKELQKQKTNASMNE